MGISQERASPFSRGWEEALHQALAVGVHGGIAAANAPLPEGGIGVPITRLLVAPPLDADTDPKDIRRLRATLEALAASTVAALWTGLMESDAVAVG